MENRLSLRSTILGIALVLTCGTARAQFTAVTGSTLTPSANVGHDYIHKLNETVDPSSGSLSLRFPVLLPPGRKLTVPLSFNYDSNGAYILEDQIATTGVGTPLWTNDPTQPYGWSFAPPQLSWTGSQTSMVDPQNSSVLICNLSTGYVFQDPSGTRHSLPISYAYAEISGQNPGTNACQYNNIQGPVMYGASAGSGSSGSDGVYQAWFNVPSNLSWSSASTSGINVYVAGPDGTVYTFKNATSSTMSCSSVCSGLPSSTFPSAIEDSNGNISTPSWSGLTPNGVTPFSLTDTAGRSAASVTGSLPALTVMVSGLSNFYSVSFGSATSNWQPNSSGGAIPGTGSHCSSSGVPKLNQDVSVISSITLPNGHQYAFSYDPTYGLLNKITYPEGGYVQYVWGANPLAAQFYFTTTTSGVTNYCLYTYDKPAITQRTVSFDGQTIALQQTFVYSTNWGTNGNWTSKTTTVTTTDNVAGVSYKTVYTYSPLYPGNVPNVGAPGTDPDVPVEQTVQYYDSNGNLLKTATKQWLNEFDLACELDTLNAGAIGGKFYTYGAGSVVTDLKEFDYGQLTSTSSCQGTSNTAPTSPTPVRETITTYQNFTLYPNFTPSPPRIYDRPCSVIINNSTGSKAAETDYFFDNGATSTVCGTAGTPSVSSVSGLPSGTHDETYYGASSTSPTSRGNLTAQIRRSLTGTSSITTYSLDETGQVLSITDPCGNGTCSDMTGSNHTTTFSYADNYSSGSPSGSTNAYVTKITNPLYYQNAFSYAFAIGKLSSSKDQNDINAGRAGTTYTYSDPLARVTAISYPDGGQNNISYNDSTYSIVNNTPNMSVTKVMNSSTSTTTITAFDGAGHVVRTLTTDPLAAGGYDIVDTAYNGRGSVRSTSNPHTTAALSTNGVKTYIYDGLGRTCLVVPQDITAPGSGTACPSTSIVGQTFTSYTNNCSTVTDETGKARTSCLNILGQMTKVLEDPNNANYETDYQYDPLGNLLGVNQKGGNSSSSNWRARTFVYDSLSQLQTATNPESGTITYAYDLNGNVFTKTDARNITTTMTYDVLNRVLTKSYSDGTTPTVSLFYDTAPAAWGSTPQNAIGRLVEATTGITPEP